MDFVNNINKSSKFGYNSQLNSDSVNRTDSQIDRNNVQTTTRQVPVSPHVDQILSFYFGTSRRFIHIQSLG